jgi:hypothetical protein
MMHGKRFKRLNDRVQLLQTWIRDLDSRVARVNLADFSMSEHQRAISQLQKELLKIDIITAMVTELAMRLDEAKIPTLPKVCSCGKCECGVVK